jgi:hypothetical protein
LDISKNVHIFFDTKLKKFYVNTDFIGNVQAMKNITTLVLGAEYSGTGILKI